MQDKLPKLPARNKFPLSAGEYGRLMTLAQNYAREDLLNRPPEDRPKVEEAKAFMDAITERQREGQRIKDLRAQRGSPLDQIRQQVGPRQRDPGLNMDLTMYLNDPPQSAPAVDNTMRNYHEGEMVGPQARALTVPPPSGPSVIAPSAPRATPQPYGVDLKEVLRRINTSNMGPDASVSGKTHSQQIAEAVFNAMNGNPTPPPGGTGSTGNPSPGPAAPQPASRRRKPGSTLITNNDYNMGPQIPQEILDQRNNEVAPEEAQPEEEGGEKYGALRKGWGAFAKGVGGMTRLAGMGVHAAVYRSDDKFLRNGMLAYDAMHTAFGGKDKDDHRSVLQRFVSNATGGLLFPKGSSFNLGGNATSEEKGEEAEVFKEEVLDLLGQIEENTRPEGKERKNSSASGGPGFGLKMPKMPKVPGMPTIPRIPAAIGAAALTPMLMGAGPLILMGIATAVAHWTEQPGNAQKVLEVFGKKSYADMTPAERVKNESSFNADSMKARYQQLLENGAAFDRKEAEELKAKHNIDIPEERIRGSKAREKMLKEQQAKISSSPKSTAESNARVEAAKQKLLEAQRSGDPDTIERATKEYIEVAKNVQYENSTEVTTTSKAQVDVVPRNTGIAEVINQSAVEEKQAQTESMKQLQEAVSAASQSMSSSAQTIVNQSTNHYTIKQNSRNFDSTFVRWQEQRFAL